MSASFHIKPTADLAERAKQVEFVERFCDSLKETLLSYVEGGHRVHLVKKVVIREASNPFNEFAFGARVEHIIAGGEYHIYLGDPAFDKRKEMEK